MQSVTAKIGLYVESDLSLYVLPGNPLNKSVGPFWICRKYIDRSDSKGDPILAATDRMRLHAIACDPMRSHAIACDRSRQ